MAIYKLLYVVLWKICFCPQSKVLCPVDLDITLCHVFNYIYAINCCLNEIYALKMK